MFKLFNKRSSKSFTVISVLAALVVQPSVLHAETLYGAMAKAYENNPDLEAARAGLRATDEGVAIAKSGYRPSLNAGATGTYSQQNGVVSRGATASVTLNQTLFDGFATRNNVEIAKARVFSGREDLQSTEISILISATRAFSNVVRDNQLVSIRRKNISFLQEQLNAARSRLNVGEGTRTDVSQAEAQLASARSSLTAATAQARSSVAVYFQIVGAYPDRLKHAKAPKRHLPSSLDAAISSGLSQHPAIAAAQYDVDIADYQIALNEASLLPGVSVSGTLSETDGGITTATGTATLSVPIYSGGANSARIRQSKQRLTQSEAQLESQRRLVERNITSDWVNYESSNATLVANQAVLRAANLALRGTIEERKVGQKTTLDVLNAQQTVLEAQESIVQSQRNSIVFGYSILASMGILTVEKLGLNVARYNPDNHYQAVKDKWFGLRVVN